MLKWLSHRRKVQREYTRSIVLRYISDHPDIWKRQYYPAFFQHELSVMDGFVFLRSLIREGYLRKDTDDVLTLTQQGEEAIKEEHTRFFDLASPYVSYSDYLTEKEHLGEQVPYEAVMLSALEKKTKEMKNGNDYGSISNLNLDMASLYEQAGAQDKAMLHYLTSLYYDTSGADYYPRVRQLARKKITRKYAESVFYGIGINPQINAGIQRVQKAYDPQLIEEIFRTEKLPFNLCSEADFDELVRQLIDESFDYNSWRKKCFELYGKLLDAVGAQENSASEASSRK